MQQQRRIRSEVGRLDVLIDNAGISHAGETGRKLEEVGKSGRPSVASIEEGRTVFETNVFGVIAVTQAMLPLLCRAPAARIVNGLVVQERWHSALIRAIRIVKCLVQFIALQRLRSMLFPFLLLLNLN